MRIILPEKFYFLSLEECDFFKSLCETIVPEGEDPKSEPGAVTVGGLSYIDSFLYELPEEARQYFRSSIGLVNTNCQKKFFKNFVQLNTQERNQVLRDFYLNPASRERMFDLRSLALEAFYSDFHDPSYSGITAWQYIEFGGKRISNLKKDWSFLQVWRDHKGKTEPRTGETETA